MSYYKMFIALPYGTGGGFKFLYGFISFQVHAGCDG